MPGLHQTAERQGIPPEVILQILKVHAYETDFRQRVRAGDAVDFFFDVKEEDKGADGSLGELLATAITSGGETHKFYRFRTPDGVVDYYDAQGNTSRKFLMRRPVRGDDVRITSGFGVRRHPILQIPKMHTGVDWACAMNTPIMAAGTGVIEEAGRKGEYGNYIRIRHANGYKTAYGHMARLPPVLRRRQGPPGPDHRLRRHNRAFLGAACALRGAGQPRLRRSELDPGPPRAPVGGQQGLLSSSASARGSTS